MSGPIALTVSGRNRALSQVADQHAKALALADLNPFAQQDTAAHHAVFFAPHRGDRNAEARELFLRGPPRVYRAGFVVAVKRQQRGYRERSQPCTRKSARTRHEISELRLGVRNSQESRNRPAWFRSLGAAPDGECPACAANCDFLGRHSLRRDQNGSSFFVHEIPLFAPAARDGTSVGGPSLFGRRAASVYPFALERDPPFALCSKAWNSRSVHRGALRGYRQHCGAMQCSPRGDYMERLGNRTLRIPEHVLALAERIARKMTNPVHEVATSEVMRRALVLGLEQLAAEVSK